MIEKAKVSSDREISRERSLVGVAMVSEFFFADIVFAFLPIAVIAILKGAFGSLSLEIFLISEWAFSSIIISSLALTRMLELKVIHQGDRTYRVLVLSRICILLVILSVICLLLYTVRDNGVSVSSKFIAIFQTTILLFGVFLLWAAHYTRELNIYQKNSFPKEISRYKYEKYVLDHLTDVRDGLCKVNFAVKKDFNFRFQKDHREVTYNESKIYKIKNMIEEIDSEIEKLRINISLTNQE